SPYFSARRSIASCTISSAACSSRTANTACLNARRSTLSRNAESSLRDARRTLPGGDVERAMLPSWFLRLFARHGPSQDERSLGRRDRCALPPGRGRRVRFRLSGWRGPVHLRRAFQAGQGQARTRKARARRGTRGGRLLALLAEGRRRTRHLGP